MKDLRDLQDLTVHDVPRIGEEDRDPLDVRAYISLQWM